MTLHARAAFVAIGLIFCLITQTVAGVIGGIDASSPDVLSQKLESIYYAVLSTGRVPVKFVTTQRGDTIEKIVRREDVFRGGYFPVILDALTCDLNPKLCHRALLKPNDQGTIRITNPLELTLTPGNWNSLQEGALLLIPQLSVDRNKIAKPYQKTAGESLASLIATNAVCVGEQLNAGACEHLIDYMNINNPRYRDVSYTGLIFVPDYDYLIDIPEACGGLCASVVRPIVVDTIENRYITTPFRLITTSSSQSEMTGQASGGNVTHFNDYASVLRDAAQGSVGIVPSDVAKKLTYGGQLIEQKRWRTPTNASQFSTLTLQPEQAFDLPHQLSMLQGINYPFASVQTLHDHVTNHPHVAIIDSLFDHDHCKLKNRIKVYDCRDKDKQFGDMCPLDTTSFDYGLMAAHVAMPEGAIPPPPPICGAAGILSIENPLPSVGFIAPRHGTHLAGLIAGDWDSFGAGGLDPFAEIIGIEADMDNLSDEAYGKWLLKTIKSILIQESVGIVDFSAGYQHTASAEAPGVSDVGGDWLQTLIHDWPFALFVAASSNQPDPNCFTIPACISGRMPNVVTTVGTNNSGNQVWLSGSTNESFTIGAPAENVFSITPRNQFSTLSGSSQSAAIVSGAASLAKSIGVGQFWTPAAMKQRLITCSNIKTSDLLPDMIGGALDVACFIHGDVDLIYPDGGVPGTEKPITGRVSVTKSKIQFVDDIAGSLDLDVARIAGFQRVAGDPEDIVIFYAKSTDGSSAVVDRLRGSFAGSQTLQILNPATAKLTKVPLSAISKYVKQTL